MRARNHVILCHVTIDKIVDDFVIDPVVDTFCYCRAVIVIYKSLFSPLI